MHLAWLLVLATQGPAARGLDTFVFGPTEGASGTTLPLEVVALGFPTVTTLKPLANAQVEAVWKPEDVGADLPAIKATTDARGRAFLDIPIPRGEAGPITLLLQVRGGDRERTKEIVITRTRGERVRLHVADASVVPGSVISAWVVAEDEGPIPHQPIELALLEGGAPRWHMRSITDTSGNVRARVPIPRTREVAWMWQLRASLVRDGKLDTSSTIDLHTREETPATPSLEAGWDGTFVKPGERAVAKARLLDATGLPISRARLEYWMGSHGTEPKDDEAWKKVSTATTTGQDGAIRLGKIAPSTIARAGGELALWVRSEIDGHALRAERMLAIGRPDPTLELTPESPNLIPGVQQRMMLRVIDGDQKGVAGRFSVEGDGLKLVVTTDAHGEAEVSWDVPNGIGATHPSGMCASVVAATVIIRPLEAARSALGRDRFERCLGVDREAHHLLVVDRSVARAGDKVKVRVLGGAGRAFTILLHGPETPYALVALADGGRGGEVAIPASARGEIELSAISADTNGPAPKTSRAIIAVPRVLPRVEAKLSGGRASPGGTVEIDVRLVDERGQGIPGLISGSIHDLFGGGSTLYGLDTREQLTRGLDLGVLEDGRIDQFFDGDPAKEAWRRAALATRADAPTEPINDPAKDAVQRFQAAFALVIRSLEGAVLEATADPDKLIDVRRKTPRGMEINPEMLTLVTGAMTEAPETPGGEPIALEDLITLDPQVRFDKVARRIARLQLFRVLEAVREKVYSERLLPSEMAMKAPDAIVRRLVREEVLQEAQLRDPWGGTIGFVVGQSEVPYLSVVRGFELHAPGPDGKLGTADDVRDPFERVLTSGSPYAKAVDEDHLVDARYEVVVGDATIEAWKSLFETLTGTVLGSSMGIGGLGTMGHGSGGRGSHSSYGHGGGRMSYGVNTVSSIAIPPQRTDAQGRLKLKVKLGDAETTWRITIVGAADGAAIATAIVDVPAYAPMSARIEAGQMWTEGDAVDVAIKVRNREERPITATLNAKAEGALELAATQKSFAIEAKGEATAILRVRASRAGRGTIDATVSAPGLPTDHLSHILEVRPAGTEEIRWDSAWIEDSSTLELPALGPGESPSGLAYVELSRGLTPLLTHALASLDPDALYTLDGETDAFETATRIARWAGSRLDPDEALVLAAEDVARRASGKSLEYQRRGINAEVSERRLALWSLVPKTKPDTCPEGNRLAPIEIIELEPLPSSDVVRACWDNAIAAATQSIAAEGRIDLLARAVIALADRPQRTGLASSLADRLREQVGNEALVLPEAESQDRASRALASAARVRLPRKDEVAAWRGALVRSQDPRGSFGSTAATRAVVTALLASELAPTATATVTVGDLDIPIRAERSTRVTMTRHTARAEISTQGGPVLARLVRPVIRAWTTPPPALRGTTEIELEWPARATAGRTARLRLSARHALSKAGTIEVRIPLPPGVALAEGRPGLIQSQGVLVASVPYSPSLVPAWIEIPVRFGLSGDVTAPESEARVIGVEGSETRARARRITIGPPS